MRKIRYKGCIGAMALLFLLQTVSDKGMYADPEQGSEMLLPETAIAGAAMTVDKYMNCDFAYSPEEIMKLLHNEEIASDAETVATEESSSEPIESTQPEETQASTDRPQTFGYTGLAICRAENYSNIRTAPGTQGEVLGKIYRDSVAQVLEEVAGEDGSWYRISSGSLTGYVKADFFAIGAEADQIFAQVAHRLGTVNTVNLRLRSTPDVSTNSNVLTKLAFGTVVVIAGEEGDFYRIEMDEGFYGYLHKDYLDVQVSYGQAISLEEERQILAEEERRRKEAEEAERLLAEKRKQEEEAAAAAASRQAEESRIAAETVVKITMRYVGPQKHAGEVLNAEDLEIAVHYADGHYAKNIPGWGCAQVGQPLPEGDVKIIASYGSVSSGLTITVLPGVQVPDTSSVVPTEPPITPTEPPITPTEPPVTPTEPPVTPTEPPVTPTEPPVNPPSAYDELRAALCAYGLQFVGGKYVFGGSSLTTGTDCSGFTMRIYEHFGIAITRTSRSQAAAGREISLDNIRPGDLLFYDTNGTITHVAMYIGNGQIVHAANAQLGILVMDAFYRMPCKAVTFLDTP